MQRYEARVLDKVHYQPGAWTGLRVGVYRLTDGQEELVGEYTRNYPSLFSTFFSFQAEGMDLALYSPSYTATRILALPECVDLGGEEPGSHGFCPVELFVPTYTEVESTPIVNGKPLQFRRNNPKPGDLSSEKYSVITPLTYYPFGFVAGCVWGDDSTWKIQYLDLSRAAEGILKREERFGYVELPENVKLSDAIDMTDYLYDPDEEDAYIVAIALRCRFDLRDGKPRNRFGSPL
jgi:hypothetical protein